MNKAYAETRKRKFIEKMKDEEFLKESYHIDNKLKHKSYNEDEDFTRI